jgi:hypothetical protein
MKYYIIKFENFEFLSYNTLDGRMIMISKEKYLEMYKLLIKEIYGVDFDLIKELSDLCFLYDINWFELFYMDSDKMWNIPKNSKYKKDKIAKKLFKEKLGILFNHTPTSNLEKVKESWTKVEYINDIADKKRIKSIAEKVKIGF